MKIDFNGIKEVRIDNFNGGEGTVRANMYMDQNNKIMYSVMAPGSSIGMHTHSASSEITYVISGKCKVICDGVEEDISAGGCHYCPKGSSHSVINAGIDDLVLFTAVTSQ